MAVVSQALQIVETGVDTDHFILNDANLTSILSKVPDGTKVAVVSVVGAFRTGKSFLLNFFLRYLRCSEEGDLSEDWMTIEGERLTEGNVNDVGKGGDAAAAAVHRSFLWRGGQERQTTGIWMWSEPFLRTPKGSSEPVAVLLMDTQGMFDNETSMALTAQIFGLSTFVSSFQVYNVEKRIQEDNLQHLALFSEYGRIAVNPKTAPADGAGKEKAAAAAAGVAVAAAKPFQRLQFLVRDWPNFDRDWDEEEEEEEGEDEDGGGAGEKGDGQADKAGAAAAAGADGLKPSDIDVALDDELVLVDTGAATGPAAPTFKKDKLFRALREEMRTYLREVIKDRGLSDLQSTREQISRCFEAVDCFLLPHPGLAVTKKNFDGSLASIGSFFKGMVNRYVRMVFDDDLAPKVRSARV